MAQRTFLLLTLLLILFNINYIAASPQLSHLMNKREFFCGKKLTETLMIVCRGYYYSPEKKSFNDFVNSDEYDDTLLYDNNNENVDEELPFLQKEYANSLLKSNEKKRGGIADECCRKPCSYKHLTLYCGR